MPEKFKALIGYITTAGKAISADKVPTMGAALAYYTAFSIAPLLVITLGVVGMVFGHGGGKQIYDSIGGLVGPNGATAIQGMVQGAASKPQSGLIATIIGVVTLILGASGIFSQLQESLNMIWRVAKKPTAGLWSIVHQRLLSFGMVGVISFLLLVSLIASAGVAAAGTAMGGALPGGAALWEAVNFVISLAVTTFLFAAIFKVLPDVMLEWRDVLTGGLFTAVLFSLGKVAIGAYLGRSGTASTYGAAGSLIVVLLWVYYTSQLVLFGAEFTRAYATRDGRPVVPRHDATITVTPFTAAALAEKAVEEGKPAAGQAGVPSPKGPLALWYGASAAALAIGGLLLARGRSARVNRAVAYHVGGGFLMGAAAALLYLLEAPRMKAEAEKDKGPSMASKILSSISTKIKVATVMGAIKGGGAEAAHEVGDKVRHMTGHAAESRASSGRKHSGLHARRNGDRRS